MKGRRLRLFIALPLPQEMREKVASLQDIWKKKAQGVRWVRPEGLHVTLKFLGHVPEGEIQGIKEVMERISLGFPPFWVRIRGAGGFPSPQRARVLWIGVEDPDGRLKGVFKALERGLERLGFPREDRPFRPHLTLGRVKEGRRFEFLKDYRDLEVGVLEVREMVLFKSELKPEGAEYESLYSVPFGGSHGCR